MRYLEISDFRFYITCMVKSFLTRSQMDAIRGKLQVEQYDKIIGMSEDQGVREKYTGMKEELLSGMADGVDELYGLYLEKRDLIIGTFREHFRAEDLSDIEFDIVPLAPFPYREYNYLIAVELNIGPLDTSKEPKPRSAFELSRRVRRVMEEVNRGDNPIWCDHLNLHPYALVVSNGVHGLEEVRWDRDTIYEQKEVLSPWIEYYSGQWDDYSEELYLSRVEGNLSNRTSELHYIRSNSAFIFMGTDDPRWVGWLHDYMQTYFVNQVLLARAILYCLMIVNDELDRVSERLRGLPEGAYKHIEAEVNHVEELNMAVSEVLTTLNRERLMNRLSHSTKVVKECFRVFSLEESAEVVSAKVKEIQQMAQTEYQKANEKLQKSQQRWMLILNALIGSQILFTIKDQLSSVPFIGSNRGFVEFFDWFVWVLFGALLVVSAGGLAVSFIRKRTTWLEKDEEFSGGSSRGT